MSQGPPEEPQGPRAELVLSVDSPVTVAQVKQRISKAHGIPEFSISLFRDSKHQFAYQDNLEIIPATEEGLIYWAFIGDAPMEWNHKKNYLADMIDKVVNQVTDQLETASFFLDTDFFWNDGVTNAEKKKRLVYNQQTLTCRRTTQITPYHY